MSSPDPHHGLAGYVLDEAVGHGGYAVVYRAHRRAGGGPVAIKMLDESNHQPVHLDRLEREYTFARRLEHPHIVSMYELGHGWLAMELARGGTAAHLPDLHTRLAVLADIASALDHAHRRGIVHCDVKPSNILLSQQGPGGRALLVDFGNAHSVAEDVWHRPAHGDVSLAYAAPEVLVGHTPTAAADEYSLACTAVELITGATPFTATSATSLIDQHLHSPAPRYTRTVEWIPRAFDSILAKAMAKDPDLRYGSCSEFITFITRVLT